MMTMNFGGKEALSTSQTDDGGMRCTVCDKHKYRFHKRKSKLLPGFEMFLCGECFEEKREPRWLIILTAQSPGGVERVKPHLVNRLYVGEEITALDLVK